MWSSQPTMLIGIDVSHPQSSDASEPSIVGIVASLDKYASIRPASWDHYLPCDVWVATFRGLFHACSVQYTVSGLCGC